MKILMQFLIGGLVGFIITFIIMNGFSIEFSNYAYWFVICLLVIIVILLVMSFLLYRQVSNLNNTEFKGEEEDEVDVIKYKKCTDYSLFVNSSTTLSILALSIALVMLQNIVLIIFSIVTLIGSYLFSAYMIYLMQHVYPDRKIPSLTDPDYAEKMLSAADEGEQYVILNGLYKSYNLLSVTLVFAIVAATLYSLFSDESQLFSIIAMCIVLLLVNGRYLLAIRNK